MPWAGYTLLELLLLLTVLAILGGMAVPATLAGLDRARGFAAARHLAGRIALARLQAVSRSATVALRFEEHEGRIGYGVFVDGNRNGVRSADIDAGIDRVLEPIVYLDALYQGAAIGVAGGAPAADPLAIGSANLLSLTPTGTATPGTIYVRGRDGTQWAVRVFGATARTRVLRYDAATSQWTEAR